MMFSYYYNTLYSHISQDFKSKIAPIKIFLLTLKPILRLKLVFIEPAFVDFDFIDLTFILTLVFSSFSKPNLFLVIIYSKTNW